MIPDYSKPSLISISTEEGSISFTAPSNGYIIGSGFGDGQAKNFLYLHCGDVSIRQQGNSNENIGSIFPVKKGDVVGINFCFSQKNNGIYFVPTVKAFGIGSKNYPSNYGTVVFIAFDDRAGNLWITAISNGTESEGSWINHKTNESDWTGWEKISTVK